jgi:hypothetical protein
MRVRSKVGRVVLILSVIGVIGCVSTVTRRPGSDWYYAGQQFGAVSVSLSPSAERKLEDHSEFDPWQLEAAMSQTLEARGLLNRESPYRLDVQVTDLRVRSTFWAFMLSFVYGADRVVGHVTLRQPATGRRLHSFVVSAYNALAGWVTLPANVRTEWLYDEFAELTVNEIVNGASPGLAASGR